MLRNRSCFWLIVALLLITARGGIIKVQQKRVKSPFEITFAQAMYSKGDSPMTADYEPSITYDFEMTDATGSGSVTTTSVVLFSWEALKQLELTSVPGCCNGEINEAWQCEDGYVGLSPLSKTVADTFTSSYDETTKILSTGFYLGLVANCDAAGEMDGYLSGSIAFLNPYGYLPGHLVSNMILYSTLTTVFSVICLFFLVRWFIDYGDHTAIQRVLLALMIITFFAYGLLFLNYRTVNNDGMYSSWLIFPVAVLKATQELLFRILMFLFCAGIGVLRGRGVPKEIKRRVYLLSCVYFIARLLLVGAFEVVGQWDFHPLIATAILLVVATCEIFWVFYCFGMLTNTLVVIARSQQTRLVRKYKLFSRCFIGTICVGLGALIIEGLTTVDFYDGWQLQWISVAALEAIPVLMTLWALFGIGPSRKFAALARLSQATTDQSEARIPLATDEEGWRGMSIELPETVFTPEMIKDKHK